MIIISAREYDFTDKESGERIQGYSCYGISQPSSTDKKTIGYSVEKFSINHEAFSRLDIAALIKNQTNVEPFYNRYGKIFDLKIIG